MQRFPFWKIYLMWSKKRWVRVKRLRQCRLSRKCLFKNLCGIGWVCKFCCIINRFVLSLFFLNNRAAVSADDPPNELKMCYGQVISREAGWEHKHCNRKEEDYHVGGLVIELERCPRVNCGSRFSMNPLKNLAHQDTVHQSIICIYVVRVEVVMCQRELSIATLSGAMVAQLDLRPI